MSIYNINLNCDEDTLHHIAETFAAELEAAEVNITDLINSWGRDTHNALGIELLRNKDKGDGSHTTMTPVTLIEENNRQVA